MRSLPLVVLFTMFIASPAFALDLQSARAGGMVAEQPTGYIKAVTPEASALVAEVNAKRKAEYERIAKEKGTKVEDVAAIAAQELMKK
jgi:uncharacterized protein